jgi:long-chain acyl-CoA synthetase
VPDKINLKYMDTERPWLKNYPSGVPANINIDQYENINAFLKESLAKYKTKKAFSSRGKEITYAQLDKMSLQLAAYLQSRGLEPGDRIALMMPNLLQYPIATFACLRAGLVLVNTNPLYTTKEMLHQFNDSGVRGIIIAENFAANLQQIIEQTQIKVVITTSIGEMLGVIKGRITDFVVRKVKRMVPKFSIPNTTSFSDAIKQGRKFTIKTFEDSQVKRWHCARCRCTTFLHSLYTAWP